MPTGKQEPLTLMDSFSIFPKEHVVALEDVISTVNFCKVDR